MQEVWQLPFSIVRPHLLLWICLVPKLCQVNLIHFHQPPCTFTSEFFLILVTFWNIIQDSFTQVHFFSKRWTERFTASSILLWVWVLSTHFSWIRSAIIQFSRLQIIFVGKMLPEWKWFVYKKSFCTFWMMKFRKCILLLIWIIRFSNYCFRAANIPTFQLIHIFHFCNPDAGP